MCVQGLKGVEGRCSYKDKNGPEGRIRLETSSPQTKGEVCVEGRTYKLVPGRRTEKSWYDVVNKVGKM